MLICHCNVVTEKEIEETILELLAEDAWMLIVPARVYHRLGKRGRCCGCFPNVVETIIRVTESHHAKSHAHDADVASQRSVGRQGVATPVQTVNGI